MAYHYWSLSDKETCVPFPENIYIWDYAILLPWYEIETQNNIIYNVIPTYTSITSSWLELTEEGYSIPKNIEENDLNY